MNEPKPGGQTAKQARLSREAAALRANLLKRKDQARARGAAKDGQPPEPPATAEPRTPAEP